MTAIATPATVFHMAFLVQSMLVMSGLGAPDARLGELGLPEKKVPERPRRLVFNTGGNEPVNTLRKLSAEALLNLGNSALAGAPVDSLFPRKRSLGFDLFTHDPRIGQVFSGRVGFLPRTGLRSASAPGAIRPV
jgi:hypothetical protein